MKAELVMSEWNYGLWAMFSSYDKAIAKESYEKGYRYCEIQRYSDDVTYLKNKPKVLFKNTKVMRLASDGNLVESK